ncbi:MAG: sulfatase-like hydrolase/transferase [Rhodospirillaceae bacterium]|nr:sulfatase-like hydrolase/transferase [Rhodospirillaceae bacterium]MDD9998599.1 sulfatase-like hydrolase/transferase [Rhodospirillaceae bacterium]MDE0363544.1 sulfatase-like hydrolase/transferase [Rhodospirillaceae bacterium]
MRRPTLQISGTMVAVTASVTMLAGCQSESSSDAPEAAGETEATAAPATPVEDNRPNILFILTDDLGYTDLGAFGGEISTPNLDTLAFEGVRLTNFHSAPYCAATRASLMSGTTSREAGVIIHNDILRPDVATMPERLGAAGYHTYISGKWNLGITVEESAHARGFESSFALGPPVDNHLAHSNFPPVSEFAPGGAWLENGVSVTLPGDWYSTDLFTDKLMEQISSNLEDDVPWFGYLALTAPHWPLQAPEDWIDRYAGRYDEGYDVFREARVARATELGVLPEGLALDGYQGRAPAWNELVDEQQAKLARAMEIYAAMVENIDWNIGRLVAFLEESGELDDTVIIFSSDNGAAGSDDTFVPPEMPRTDNDNSLANMGRQWSFTAYDRGWAEAATAPFREVKTSMYAGGTQVSTFVRHPDVANKGSIERTYLTVMDLLPTFLHIAEAPPPTDRFQGRPVVPVRGRSFWNLLRGGEPPETTATPWITTIDRQAALVLWPWKIVTRPTDGSDQDDSPLEWDLFNLEDDPGERRDVSELHPDTKAELVSHWADYADGIGL